MGTPKEVAYFPERIQGQGCAHDWGRLPAPGALWICRNCGLQGYGLAAQPRPEAPASEMDDWCDDAEMHCALLSRAPRAESDHVPTQWAYDQACTALEKHRSRAEAAAAERDRFKEANTRLVGEAEREAGLSEVYRRANLKLREENDALKAEVAALREYGNKDCTAQADAALLRAGEGEEPKREPDIRDVMAQHAHNALYGKPYLKQERSCATCIHLGEWDIDCVNCVRVEDRKDNWTPAASGEGI